MFDFPANPAIGDASNGYVFNGVGWAGGPIAGTPTEQFFTLDGLAQQDITVPSWAVGVHIEGSVWTLGYVGLRVSWDGTTFLAGATDYTYAGPFHDVAGGTPYQTVASTNGSHMVLAWSATTATVPSQFDANMRLVTAAGQLATLRGLSTNYNSTTAQRHFSLLSYPAAVVVGSIKKLRILATTGTFGAGSWVRVKWLGASSDIPQSNAPGEAPQTGGEYVRINGIWRLKSQTLVLDGATQVGVPVAVPTNARAVKFSGSINIGNNAASLSASMRWSVDGTTFPAGAADYSYSGSYFGSVAGPAALPSATASYALMTISSASANCPVKFDGSLQLSRTGTQLLLGKCYSTSLQSGNHYQGLIQFWAAGAAFTIPTVLKALNFGAHGNAVTLAADSYVDLEWVY